MNVNECELNVKECEKCQIDYLPYVRKRVPPVFQVPVVVALQLSNGALLSLHLAD